MFSDLPLFPERASTIAPGVDALYAFLLAMTLFFSVLIFTLVFVFAVRYRRRSESERPPEIHGSLRLEIAWTLIPLLVSAVIFLWGSKLFFDNQRVPRETLEIFVVGKQWMWKYQHPEGPREINELHVPIGRAVKLTMTSQDVIHSQYVPAFRVKMDVLPGRYTTLWFEPTRVGTYHLFCAEYCGTKHSEMGGWVHVLEPMDYERWLSGGSTGETMASAGERIFSRTGCNTCHVEKKSARGPSLAGLFGKTVAMRDGGTVVADEGYLRESIVNPNARIVEGFTPLMPTYKGQLSEEEILQLIAYVKSLEPKEGR